MTPATNVVQLTAEAITVTAATCKKLRKRRTSARRHQTEQVAHAAGSDAAVFTETYDNKNAGTGKTLTAAGSVTDGNGGNNYAVIFIAFEQRHAARTLLTVTATTNTKIYDGTISATAIPTITGGTLALVSTTRHGFTESYDNKNVGTGKTLTAASSSRTTAGGNNYVVAFIANTDWRHPGAQLTVTATRQYYVYGLSASSAAVQPLREARAVTAAATESCDMAKTVGTGKTLTAAGTVNDGNGGNNYAVTFSTDTSGVITARAIIVTAFNFKVYDGTIQHFAGHFRPSREARWRPVTAATCRIVRQ